MRNLWSLLLLGFLCFSCTKKEVSNIVDETSFNQEDTLLIDVKAYLKPMLRLTPEAQEATENWIVYKTLSQNLRNRDTIRIGKLKTNIAAMKTVFVTQNEAQDAQVSVIPSQLELPSIQARTLAVETQVKVLINLLEKKQLETDQITKEWGGLHNAFQNLNLQINERFSVSIEDLLEEARSSEDDFPEDISTGKPPIQKQ